MLTCAYVEYERLREILSGGITISHGFKSIHMLFLLRVLFVHSAILLKLRISCFGSMTESLYSNLTSSICAAGQNIGGIVLCISLNEWIELTYLTLLDIFTYSGTILPMNNSSFSTANGNLYEHF